MSEHQQTQQSRKPDSTFQKQAALTSQMHVSSPASIIQRVGINPKSLTSADVLQLQRTIGNRAVGRLLSGMRNSSMVQQATVQRQEIPEKEEPLQGKMIETIQRQKIPEEEEPLQGKFKSNSERATCPSCSALPIIQKQEIPDEEELQMKSVVQRQEIPEEEEPLQGKIDEPVQRQEIPEEEEPLQGKMIGTIQRQEIPEEEEPLQTKRENNTGMPDNLKAGVESLSGIDMSDVRVHYNSSKPADVGALAYTQGTNIHVAPGQERHLPHEAWHVVQQIHGRVKPTMQAKGVSINDDATLEREADVMGGKVQLFLEGSPRQEITSKRVIQRVINLDLEGIPALNSIVHIRSMTRPATPDTTRITGMNAADPAARHIIPQALIDRNFKTRFTGKTVGQLQAHFPSVVIGPNYLIDIATAMQRAYSYENLQLNQGGGIVGFPPEGAKTDLQRNHLQIPTDDGRGLSSQGNQTPAKRNYWEGSQQSNLDKDTLSSAKLNTIAKNSDNNFGIIDPATKMGSPYWAGYQLAEQDNIIEALAEEFDPPPFTSKAVIQFSATEWARLTNEWLTNDLVACSYYAIGRLFQWQDAVRFGNNQAVYNSAR
jgi:hypothetical protein